MPERSVYYPDLDWPRNNAPANYVPVREGGGTTAHGNGTALGEIDPGDRTIRVIALYEHTPGSTGYLDTENNFIATGDAIGSGPVWAHFGLISQYAETVRHLRDVIAPMNNPALLPAHFYQVDEVSRGPAPIRGRPLDKQYVEDEIAAAEGVLNGTLLGSRMESSRQRSRSKRSRATPRPGEIARRERSRAAFRRRARHAIGQKRPYSEVLCLILSPISPRGAPAQMVSMMLSTGRIIISGSHRHHSSIHCRLRR